MLYFLLHFLVILCSILPISLKKVTYKMLFWGIIKTCRNIFIHFKGLEFKVLKSCNDMYSHRIFFFFYIML